MRSQPFQFRVRHLLIAVACVAAGLFICNRTVGVIGLGSYDFEVRLARLRVRIIPKEGRTDGGRCLMRRPRRLGEEHRTQKGRDMRRRGDEDGWDS